MDESKLLLMKKYLHLATAILAFIVMPAAGGCSHGDNADLNHARTMMKTIFSLYRVDETPLLAENYPRQSGDRATYLAEGADQSVNEYSYLWPYSGTLSMMSALYDATGDSQYLDQINHVTLEGLDRYYDTSREPYAYASYITTSTADRFYDDNIWLGIDMADLYAATGKKIYLQRAEEIWAFVMSGYDDKLGGGIYWCEQKKESKNTCSNAPASVFALKMYNATKEKKYLERGKDIYKWTKDSLEDKTDHLYFDHLTLKGRLGRDKYSYNTGQMLQAAAMLYKITGDRKYLDDARLMAAAAYDRFFEDKGRADGLRILRGGEMWFDSVMLRGYIELYGVDNDGKYLKAFLASVDTAWGKGGSRDADGLFGRHYDERGKKGVRTLLNQAAMIEMMARLSAVK